MDREDKQAQQITTGDCKAEQGWRKDQQLVLVAWHQRSDCL
jgi:hypothetical protein